MNNVDEIKVVYASDVDRDEFLAEFYSGDKQWAEMTYNTPSSKFILTIWDSSKNKNLVLDVADLERVLQVAKQRLTPLGPEIE
ncbi:MAG: hypothetical protein M3Y74_10665 [Chloroflexota bacterium]|nr:hypothetical protein [Chloroflexota bacterium]